MLTLTGDAILSAPTNLIAGAIVVLMVRQDSVGGHVLTYDPAVFSWASTPPVIDVTANSNTTLSFICDGTILHEW